MFRVYANVSSVAECILVVGGVRQQLSQYVMLIRLYSCKQGIVAIGKLKAKFHYAGWFEAGSELVRGWSQTGSSQIPLR